MPVIGDHRDRFAVVTGNRAAHQLAGGGGETNALAQAEIDHLAVSFDLLHQADPRDDHAIKLNQLVLSQ